MYSVYAVLALLAVPAALASPVPASAPVTPAPRGGGGNFDPTHYPCYPTGFQPPCGPTQHKPPPQQGCDWWQDSHQTWHECPNWGSGSGWNEGTQSCNPCPGYSCHNNNMWATGPSTECNSCVPWCGGHEGSSVLECLDIELNLDLDLSVTGILGGL